MCVNVCVNVCVCVCVSVSVCECVYGACDMLKCSSGLPLLCCVPAVHIMQSWLLSAWLNVVVVYGSLLAAPSMGGVLGGAGRAAAAAFSFGSSAAFWPPGVFGHGLPA